MENLNPAMIENMYMIGVLAIFVFLFVIFDADAWLHHLDKKDKDNG